MCTPNTSKANVSQLNVEESSLLSPIDNNIQEISSTSSQDYSIKIFSFGESSPLLPIANQCQDLCSTKSIGVQVLKRLSKSHVRSVASSCVPLVKDADCQSSIETCDKTCFPIKISQKNSIKSTTESSYGGKSTSTSELLPTISEYQPSSTNSEDKKEEQNTMNLNVLKMTNYLISKDPKFYIGVSSECI